jgi:hypothetical protein
VRTRRTGPRGPGCPCGPGTPAKGLTVTRLANADSTITFTGTQYRAGRSWARTFPGVTIVAGSVQRPKDGKVIRLHPIRHDRARELGAFANPQGRARRKNSAIGYAR